jgi:hypothetical protein
MQLRLALKGFSLKNQVTFKEPYWIFYAEYYIYIYIYITTDGTVSALRASSVQCWWAGWKWLLFTVTFDGSRMWDIKPCQSTQTASSERAQSVSGKAHPAERSIWPKGHRALSNYRRYRFGLMGLISVVLMSRMKVIAIYSHLWWLTNVGHQTVPERSNCKQWACGIRKRQGSSCRALNTLLIFGC